MQLTLDIPEQDLAEFGKETIRSEFAKMLKWLKIKQSLKRISESLKKIDEKIYYAEIEKIRESSWDQYKQEIGL
jgi:hypothetical protein